MEVYEWYASAFGVVGALLVALNIPKSRYGFVLFLVSSAMWSYVAYQSNLVPLLLNQLVFVAINVVGIQRWFFSSNEAETTAVDYLWYCNNGCMAHQSTDQPSCHFCSTAMSTDPTSFEIAGEERYCSEQLLLHENEMLIARVYGIENGKHQIWYCPRGHNEHSSIHQPECGACGCPMQTDSTSYDSALQYIEDKGISAVEASMR